MKRLGAFYREKVLSLKPKDLEEIKLPRRKELESEVKLESVLFGFRLHTDARFIELPTEEEARYCKIFTEIGLAEVMVPRDINYLRIILPELEELKRKHDRILNQHLQYVFSHKQKMELFYSVWDKMMWEEAKQ